MRSRDRRVLQLQRLRKEYERKLQENASLLEENQTLKAACDTLRGQIHVVRDFSIGLGRSKKQCFKKWRKKNRNR